MRHPWVTAASRGARFGVMLPSGRRQTPATGWILGDDPLRDLLAAGRFAELLGFDAVFLPDYSWIFPDPFVYLAALAVRTERVRLGVLVASVFLRHPTYLARVAADLDLISNGRLVLGLGIGETEAQFGSVDTRFGTVAERQAGLLEALEIIRGVWGHEPYSFNGVRFTAGETRVIPPPVQQPRPPIIIGGGGNRTLEHVARYADACNFGGSSGAVTPNDIRSRLDRLNGHCDTAGRPYDDILRTHLGMVVLAESEVALSAKLGRYFDPPTLTNMQEIGWLVAGTPGQVVPYYRERIAAGMQYFVTLLADTADRETLNLLAHDVMPHVSS